MSGQGGNAGKRRGARGRRERTAGSPLGRAKEAIERPSVVGPGFHRQVFALVRQVPAGRVTTYGDVATMLGSPRVARHVGWALAALDDARVPWQRVINAQGRISFKGDIARVDLQRRLLEAEGVTFDARDRVDLKRFRHDYAGARPAAGRAPRATSSNAAARSRARR